MSWFRKPSGLRSLLRWIEQFLLIIAGSAIGAALITALLYGLGSADIYNVVVIHRFQTLIAGILAIVAAGIAFFGAVRSASIEARAIQRDREEQINFERQKAQETLRNDCIAFAMALRVHTAIFAEQLKRYTQQLRLRKEYRGILYALQWNTDESFLVNHPLLSEWRNIALLEQKYAQMIFYLFWSMQHMAIGFKNMKDLILEHPHKANASNVEALFDEMISLSEQCSSTSQALVENLNSYLKEQGVQAHDFYEDVPSPDPKAPA